MTTSETTALPGPAPTWLEHMGDRVVVYTLRGSYAERRATDVLHGSELVARELERLLAIETFGPRIKIYLVDAPAGQPAHGRGKAGVEESEAPIVFAVEPETAGGPPPSSLARVLVARWFSGQAAGAELVLAALGGLAAARAGVGPSLEEANAWVRQELEKRTPRLDPRGWDAAGQALAGSRRRLVWGLPRLGVRRSRAVRVPPAV